METDFAALEAQIASNPYDENAVLRLIDLLSSNAESNELRVKCDVYRSSYADRFLPNVSFWLNWLSDLKAQQNPDPVVISALFDRALNDCPHHLLVVSYLEDMQEKMEAELINEEGMRGAFEKAINLCGADIMTGSTVWLLYTGFEVAEFEDVMDIAETDQEIGISKQRIIHAFHRQLALPLQGNEKALRDFEAVLEEICVGSDVALVDPAGLDKKNEAAKKERNIRMNVELQLEDPNFLTNASLADQLRKWKWYIKLEIKADLPSRAQRLYERAVMYSPLTKNCEELWQDYAYFAAHTVRNYGLLESVLSRALKPCYNSLPLWRYRLLDLEMLLRPDEEIHKNVQAALLCGFSRPDDYLTVLQMLCDARVRGLRRCLDSSAHSSAYGSENTDALTKCRKSLNLIRGAFDEAEAFLLAYFPQWAAGWLTLYKHRAEVENEALSIMRLVDLNADQEPSPALAVWERALEHLSPSFHAVWQEYLSWMSEGRGSADTDVEQCRALYRRAIAGKQDPNIEALCHLWIAFEQRHGTADDVMAAIGKTGPIISHWVWRRSEQENTSGGNCITANGNNNSSAVVVAGSGAGRTSKGAAGPSANREKQARKRPAPVDDSSNSKIANDNSGGIKPNQTADSAASKRQRVESSNGSSHGHNDNIASSSLSDDLIDRTVRIKNMLFSATTQEITTHFATTCGDVVELHVSLSPAGKFSGEAFVTFSTQEGFTAALKLNGTNFLERTLAITPCFGGDEQCRLETMEQVRQSFKRVFVLDYKNMRRDNGHPPNESKKGGEGNVDGPLSNLVSKTVFVSRFSSALTSDGLRAIFESCGEIAEAKVFMDSKTGASKKVGIVRFVTEEGKLAAFQLNRTTVNGEKIAVAPSKFEPSDVASIAPAHGPPGSDTSTSMSNASTAAVKPAAKGGLGFKPRTLKLKL